MTGISTWFKRQHAAVRVCTVLLLVLAVLLMPTAVLADSDDFFRDDGHVYENFKDVSDWDVDSGLSFDAVDDDTITEENPRGEWLGGFESGSGGSDNIKLNDSRWSDRRPESLLIWMHFNEDGQSDGNVNSFSTEPNFKFATDTSSQSFINQLADESRNTWVRVRVDFDWDSGVYNTTVTNRSGAVLKQQNGTFTGSEFEELQFNVNQNCNNGAGCGSGEDVFYFDYLADTQSFLTVQGTVTDQDGDAIQGAEVELINATTDVEADSDLTDSNGAYSVQGLSGSYEVEAGTPNHKNVTKTISGTGTKNLDFALTELNTTLELRVKKFLKHGESAEYEIINTNASTADRRDVTSQATVSSNNTTLLTVDKFAENVIATSDTSKEGLVNVTATYENKTVTTQIFVGNTSMDNFGQLPPWGRFEALVGSNVEGDSGNDSFIILLAAALTGAALRLGSTYMGLAGFQLVIIAGWIIDKTSTGVMLVTLAVVGFVALNLAANIDFGGSRVSGFRNR